ncbi:MAG: RDD family protein [Micrococcales bacterium]|nr:MAG: RDD family protein [Micrococcales bacterium]
MRAGGPPPAARVDPVSLLRRIIGLVVDWGLARLVSVAFFDDSAVATLVVFFVGTAVLVGTWGATFGHVLVRVRVVREDGGWAGPLRTLVRTLALCLVLPAVLTDATGRRFHDKWAGTVLARMGT